MPMRRYKIVPPVMKVKVINPLTGRWVTVKENKRQKQDTVSAAPSQPSIPTRQVADTVLASCSHQSMPTTSCMDSFDFMAVDPENGASSYWKKKVNHSDKWEKIRKELLVVHTELCAVADQSQCICCGFNLSTIRCLDCGSHALFCEKDFLERHKNAVFHSPEIWNGHCFVPYAANLPVLVHSNHKIPNCAKRTREIIVIGMRGGPQLFTFEFCSCESDTITLLRHRLWGSSPETPSVAFKLDVMEWLRALVFECKVSVKGFVNALATQLSKIENISSKKINGVYQALVTDAFTMYMHHKYQLQQLQHIDPNLDEGTSCPAYHVVKEDIEVNAKDLAVDGSQLALWSQYPTYPIDALTDKCNLPHSPYVSKLEVLVVTPKNVFIAKKCHKKGGWTFENKRGFMAEDPALCDEETVQIAGEQDIRKALTSSVPLSTVKKNSAKQQQESGEEKQTTGFRTLWTAAEVLVVQQHFSQELAGLKPVTRSSIDSFLAQQTVVKRTSTAVGNYLLRNRKKNRPEDQ